MAACAIVIEPDTGEVFHIPAGESSVDINIQVQTSAGEQVWIVIDGLVNGSPTNADGEGVAYFTRTFEEGGHSLQARTGSGDDEMDSEVVNITVEAADTRPPLTPGMTLVWYMNWIANTFDVSVTPPVPLYTTAEAAAVWAGVPLGFSLAYALNHKLGFEPGSWVTVNTALNLLAGTTGLSNVNAAYAIASAM